MAVLFVIGMPIAFALGLGSFFALLADPNTPLVLVPQRMFTALDSWPIMAIPLFMLAGVLMDKGGISQKIVDFSSACLGFVRGSLGMITVAASMVFAGISGSSTADTATEAAVVAVVYGLIVGMFVYKKISVRDLPKNFIKAAEISCIVMFIATTAFLFAWLLTVKQVPVVLGEYLQNHIASKVLFLVLLNIILLVIGMFMESFSAIIVFMPILFPIAQGFGIDPVHFGIIASVNLAIGYITPPYGATLFVSSSLSGESIRDVTPKLVPIILAMLLVLLIVTYIPETFMWIPNLIAD
ncbi:TRAP transporter large permease [Acidobacteriota bacterium]